MTCHTCSSACPIYTICVSVCSIIFIPSNTKPHFRVHYTISTTTTTTTITLVSDSPTLEELKCHDCGNSISPVWLNVVAYFTHPLQKQNKSKAMAKGKQRVKPEYYGETLTRDEVVQRLEENEKQKRENSKAKGGKERRNNQLWRIHDMTNTISRYIMIIL